MLYVMYHIMYDYLKYLCFEMFMIVANIQYFVMNFCWRSKKKLKNQYCRGLFKRILKISSARKVNVYIIENRKTVFIFIYLQKTIFFFQSA
jgi:hypothetical protein